MSSLPSMKLRLLGTGNPVPGLKRASSSYLLHVGDDVLLLDHGPGAYWRLMESGGRAVDITHVILTHLHYDHCVDLVRLYLNRWDQGAGRIPPLKIYGPRGTQHFVDRLFGPDGAFKSDLAARTGHPESIEVYRARGGLGKRALPQTEVTEIKSGDEISGAAWRLKFFAVPHGQPYLACYGVRLESHGRIVSYTSDITPPFDLNDEGLPVYRDWQDPRVRAHYKPVFNLMRDADVLIQYFHLPNAEMLLGKPAALPHRQPGNIADRIHVLYAEMAQEARVKELVLTHFSPNLEGLELRARISDDMRQIFKAELVWGEDLQEFDLSAATPTIPHDFPNPSH